MRRILIAAALIAVTAAATAYVASTRSPQERHQAGSVRGSQLKRLKVPKIGEPPPSLEGRIPISEAQLREAEAAGLVDRPIKTILDVPQRMSYGDYVWNDRGVPEGPVWIRVDLSSQLLSVFRSGHEIGTAVILYGADGLPTPTGKFPILAKWKDHKSATYGDAPMPYTLRLTNDGVSIHGSNVRWGFATHGCVGIPKAFAAKVFEVVSKGDEVLIVPEKSKGRTA
ncbi:MAG TPA: L,D-transpeptidase family protein [Sphingomicrobium sp.]|nr:L,D-transpeptidase family protein [Sphingomicrobium sp.]